MTQVKRDYYEVLGVRRNASPDEIKSAFRKLAKEFHPDRNPGNPSAADRFKEAAEANEILSDKEKRAAYDRGELGTQGASAGGFGFDGLYQGFDDDYGSGAFDELFDIPGKRRQGPKKGSSLRVRVTIDFVDACKGTKKQIDMQRGVRCQTCSGSGAKPGTVPRTCANCKGRGETIHASGYFQVNQRCAVCRGAGQTKDPCLDCSGTKKKPRSVVIDIPIPGGVKSEECIKLAGQGEPGDPGAPAGDLLCFVTVKPHVIFRREDMDVVSDHHVPFVVAALGGKIEVQTIDGPRPLDVKSGLQSGDVLRLKGLGVRAASGTGDHLVKILVDVPRRLTPRQEELLREFANQEEKDGNAWKGASIRPR